MVSEARRSGMKSAGRRRFFGSKNILSEHSHGEDSHKSTSTVLKSLFFHNPQRSGDDVLSYVPSDPHVSLTSQTSYFSGETNTSTSQNATHKMERTNGTYRLL